MAAARRAASRKPALDRAAFGFAYVYGVLAVVWRRSRPGWKAPWKAQAKPVTVTRVVAPATGAALAAAWGRPDSTVPGAQINSGLAGLTCDVWRARKAVVCFA